jgi:cobalt-zinc-cadmium efflux system outer membrane protein
MRLLWIAVLVASCVPSRSEVFHPVERDISRLGLETSWTEAPRTTEAIDRLLARPIDRDTAIRIALARNARLQARFEDLGVAASRIADATVLPPATIDFDYKFGVSSSASELEGVAVQDVLDLLQLGQRRAIAGSELAAAQARATAAVVTLAAQTEVAFNDLVAAQQDRELVQTAFAAASATADLVERQHAAGNATDLALAREQAQREQFRVELTAAGATVEQRDARLRAVLGLRANEPPLVAAGRLPDLPAAAPKLDDLERGAQTASLAAAALNDDARAAAARHRYAVVRAFLPELGVGAAVARRETEGWTLGPAIRIGIPLFDQQQGPRARALAEERRARDELAATASDVDAAAQAARSRALAAYAQARQLHDVVLPLRQQVLQQTLLQYNAMNASTFELLMARRDVVDAGRQYVDAARRYWDAMAAVEALRRGGQMSPMENTP